MTTDIEKLFFETFNIEKRQVDCEQLLRLDCEDCKTCEYSVYEYPEITDRILLELICIAMGIIDFGSSNVEGLKEVVLTVLVEYTDEEEIEEIKQQIQSLFKEG